MTIGRVNSRWPSREGAADYGAFFHSESLFSVSYWQVDLIKSEFRSTSMSSLSLELLSNVIYFGGDLDDDDYIDWGNYDNDNGNAKCC